MGRHEGTFFVLMAEDDPDDCLLVKDAFMESGFINDLRFVENGEALMDYLYQRGEYKDTALCFHPDLILLDLNMPKKDGREALKEIKSDPQLRSIPVIIFTTSKEERDILYCYEWGANSFITKSASFEELLEMIKLFGKYWFETVELPSCREEVLNG